MDGTADKAISIIEHVKQYNLWQTQSKIGTTHKTAQTEKHQGSNAESLHM